MSWFWPKKKAEEPPKPEDEVTFVECLACPKGHIRPEYSATYSLICSSCGEKVRKAVAKKTVEATLVFGKWSYDSAIFPGACGYTFYIPPRRIELGKGEYEFVRYLDEDSDVKLSDELLSKLKVRAARDTTRHITNEELSAYSFGLQDGETTTAQWLLEEIQKETK